MQKSSTARSLGLKSSLFQFISLSLARSFAARSRAMVVVLGDHPMYWVVTMADATRLERLGYEWA